MPDNYMRCTTPILLATLSACMLSCSPTQVLQEEPAAQQPAPVIGEAFLLELPIPADPGRDTATAGYQSVTSGDNMLDLQATYASSGGAAVFEFMGADVILFSPSEEELSYVHYALEDIPAGELIRSIHWNGKLNEEEPAGAGYYIAWADYASGSYRWFGPIERDSEYELFNHGDRNVSGSGRGHIIIGVSGTTQNALAGELSVNIGHGPLVEAFDELPMKAKLP